MQYLSCHFAIVGVVIADSRRRPMRVPLRLRARWSRTESGNAVALLPNFCVGRLSRLKKTFSESFSETFSKWVEK
jgi:hypothetical protein